MRFLKVFFGAIIFYLLFFISFSPISSCKKEIIHDTTVHTIHDTTIKDIHDTTIKDVHDTTTVKDSVYDLRDGLVAYYNFNGGNLDDSSGNNNNIIFNNATSTTDRFGNADNAYLFNGIDAYMQVSHSPTLTLDNITVFAIFKVNGFSNVPCHGNEIVGKGTPDNTNGFYALRFADINGCNVPIDSAHEVFNGIYGDNNPIGTSQAAPDSIFVQKDRWYQIAFTFDGIWSKMYIDGVLKDARQRPAAYHHNVNDLFIGRHESPAFPYWFNGVMDEVRIYNRSLPAGAVKQLSNQKN